jgi:hypothetical protein
MGNKTIHVGFGTSQADHTKVVWGAGGKAMNAPEWLRRTAEQGWSSPVVASLESIHETDEEITPTSEA